MMPTYVPPPCRTCQSRSWNDLLTTTEAKWIVLPADGGEYQLNEKTMSEERDNNWLCLNGHPAGDLSEEVEHLYQQSIARQAKVVAEHARENPDLIAAPVDITPEGVSILRRIVEDMENDRDPTPAIVTAQAYLATLANPNILDIA